jgi:hypothetical protein
MDAWIKNLWLLLTLAIPGATTYGTFRVILLLNGSTRIDKSAFEKIDSSGLLTTCIIVALAVLQQAIAIPIEPLLSAIFKRHKPKYNAYYLLFSQRFKRAAGGELNEDATRIMGNFFMSVNVIIGQCMILLYLVGYEAVRRKGVVVTISVIIAMGLISAVYRLHNAASIASTNAEPKLAHKMGKGASAP